LDELAAPSACSFASGCVDTRRFVAMGWSTGGAAALSVCTTDERCRGVVTLDGPPTGRLDVPLEVPFLRLANWLTSPASELVASRSRATSYARLLEGVGHMEFSLVTGAMEALGTPENAWSVLVVEAAAPQPARHPLGDALRERRDVPARGRAALVEGDRGTFLIPHEDAIGHDDVKMHEAAERRVEALHERDGARLATLRRALLLPTCGSLRRTCASSDRSACRQDGNRCANPVSRAHVGIATLWAWRRRSYGA
jgi:pimeloyl-ACP methyl ester carboxylesterase